MSIHQSYDCGRGHTKRSVELKGASTIAGAQDRNSIREACGSLSRYRWTVILLRRSADRSRGHGHSVSDQIRPLATSAAS
jgi:hypothetical protein